MQHFGTVIAGAAGWDCFRADEPGKTQAAKIDRWSRSEIRGKLAVMRAVIAPKVLAVELVAAVHGGWEGVLGLFDLTNLRFTGQRVHPISCDGAWVDKFNGIPLPLRLFHRQPKQVQRSFNIDTMGSFRVVFGFCRENGCKMINRADLMFHHKPAKQDLIENIAHNPFRDHRPQRLIERIYVNRDNRTIHSRYVAD